MGPRGRGAMPSMMSREWLMTKLADFPGGADSALAVLDSETVDEVLADFEAGFIVLDRSTITELLDGVDRMHAQGRLVRWSPWCLLVEGCVVRPDQPAMDLRAVNLGDVRLTLLTNVEDA